MAGLSNRPSRSAAAECGSCYIGATPQLRQNSDQRQEAKKSKSRPERPGEIQEQQSNANDTDSSFLQVCHDAGKTISGLAESPEKFV